MTDSIPDTVTDRVDVLRLTVAQHELMIIDIQRRRLALRMRLDTVEAAKIGAHIDVLSSRLETVCTQIATKIGKLDKTISTIEEKLRKAEALAMEITHERSELARIVPSVPAGELPEPVSGAGEDAGMDQHNVQADGYGESTQDA